MCTVSIVPHHMGVRVLCNRDELRTRPAARPPTLCRTGERIAAFPVDPAGGGTWIGVNDAGLVVALLNRNGATAGTRRTSRGLIVRALLKRATLVEVRHASLELDPAEFDPFEVVALRGSDLSLIASDGRSLRIADAPLTTAMLFTSSSLGDSLVDAPRRRLFARTVLASDTAPLHAQANFHRHQWRARPEISVQMSRRDAATVSRTVIDVRPRGYGVIYEPLDNTGSGRREWCFFH